MEAKLYGNMVNDTVVFGADEWRKDMDEQKILHDISIR